jgi:hypothetical protein
LESAIRWKEKTMSKCVSFTWLALVMMGVSAVAQTVTGSGTTNTVPVFTGSSTVGNSPISVSGSTVNIANLQVGAVISATVAGQAFYTAHQVGSGYGYPLGMFFAETDNPTGTENYYFQGVTNGTQNYSLRADGTSYQAGTIDLANYGFASSYRGPQNNYTNLFLGGSIFDTGGGSYTVTTDGGSNYFAAIRMDNSGGNAGAINFYSAPTISGSSYSLTNAQLATYQRMTIVGGNVGIGTTAPGAKFEVNGNVKLTSGSGASVTYQDGTVQTTAWNGVLGGGDYAESVDVSGDRALYEPGDVLVIDPSAEGKFLRSSQPYSTAVMGIYSTKPGVVGRRQISDKSHMKAEVPMAMVGVVPTKVNTEGGAIKPGDLLVTSSTPGYAMRGSDRSQLTGAIIGKALGHLDAGKGVIEVAVSIQ